MEPHVAIAAARRSTVQAYEDFRETLKQWRFILHLFEKLHGEAHHLLTCKSLLFRGLLRANIHTAITR